MTIPLGSLIRLHYGKALKSDVRDNSGAIPVFGANGLIGSHAQSLFEGESIIIGRKGSVGKVTYAPSGGWVIDTAFYIQVINPKRLLFRYLFHALQSLNLQALAITTSIPGISRDEIYAQKISIPSVEEQRRITTILDKAEDIRRKRQEALKLAGYFLKSVFLDMFGNPMTNPKGWTWGKLTDLGTLDRGVSKHRPRNAPELLGGPYPLVQTSEVSNCDRYIRYHNATYSEIGFKQSKIWPRGTLCITIAANIAKTGILDFDSCFPDSVVGFIPYIKESTGYVQIWFTFLQKIIERNAPESAQKNINLEILRNLAIPIPPEKLQIYFSHQIAQLERIKINYYSQISDVNLLFNGLRHIFLN